MTFAQVPIKNPDYNFLTIEFWHNQKGDLGYAQIKLGSLEKRRYYTGWFGLKGKNVKSGQVKVRVIVLRDLSEVAAQTYKQQIIEECQKTGQKWCDPEFPADNTSIYVDPKKPRKCTSKSFSSQLWFKIKTVLVFLITSFDLKFADFNLKKALLKLLFNSGSYYQRDYWVEEAF